MPNNGLGELERLTIGEKLLINRRRKGKSQTSSAKFHQVSQSTYGRWERDEEIGPKVMASGLRPHERCLLYRRRAGCTQQQVAEDLDVCRWWINKMERGLTTCDQLLWYWEQ